MPSFSNIVPRITIPVLIVLLSVSTTHAENGLAEDGLLVSVPNPITSEAVTRIRQQISQARSNPNRPIRKIVFDFNNGKDANTSDPGPCLSLATYIKGLLGGEQGALTIAYVTHNASGHTVAPILACQELAMSRTASLGEIAPPGETLPRYVTTAYDEILDSSRQGYRAVIRKMYDRSVSLGKGKRNGADYYIDLRDRDKEEARGVRIADPTPLPFAGPNAEGKFSAERLRDLGLVKTFQDTRKDLAEAYGLSESSLREDPLAGREPVAYRYTLRGNVDGGMKESVTRVITDVVRRGGNMLFLELECGGGDFSAARDLADKLIEFQNGESPILIVAFIPNSAPDTAAIIALGCSEIVMSRRKDATDGGEGEREATIGGFENLIGRDANRADLWKQSLRGLAEKQGHPALLLEGLVDRDLTILKVHKANERTTRRLMSESEYEMVKRDWVNDGVIKPKDQLLILNSTRAAEVGLARQLVDHRDISEVYSLYGLDGTKVREATPGWLDRFANYLRLPTVTVLLVVIGFIGLILELKVPGTTVPGIIAALCFILVFWAHSQFNGQAAVLGGLLFALGLVLILMEVFVIPGFGVTGVLGILLMIGGIGLATMDRIPQSPDEWGTFGVNVGQYIGALVGAMFVAMAVARYLPRIPYANKLMLVPPTEKFDAGEVPVDLPGASQAASLLGAVGVSATPLRPAGMALFGEQYVDVVTEGGFIPSGSRVQVIEVEGVRIVVKEV